MFKVKGSKFGVSGFLSNIFSTEVSKTLNLKHETLNQLVLYDLGYVPQSRAYRKSTLTVRYETFAITGGRRLN